MDLTKLLQSLEEFIFQVATLVVLIPKTFFKLAFFPDKVCRFVANELTKSEETRFDNQASPLILWLVTGLVPHFIVLSVLASLMPLQNFDPDGEIIKHLLSLSAEARFTALSVLAVSLPIALAVITVRERRQSISKTSLRGPLYCFCYVICPPLVAMVPVWLLLDSEHRKTPQAVLEYVEFYGDCVAIWFTYITLHTFRCLLDISWKRSFILLCKAYAAFLVFLLILELSILLTVELMNMPSAPKEKDAAIIYYSGSNNVNRPSVS